MTQEEFFQQIENLGIDLQALRIVVGRCSGRAGVHGIYEKDGQWIYYFADDRNDIYEEIVGNEEEAFDKMYRYTFVDLRLKRYLSTTITEDIAKIDKQTVCQFISKTYSMSEQKANDMWNNLKRDMHVLFEFKYYVANNEFVPDKFCYKVRGYSAEQLYNATSLTTLGAFNYMVYLKRKPEEALANLQKELPRRRLLSPQDVEELKKYMD